MNGADAWDSAERMLDGLVGPGQSGTTHRVAHDYLIEFGRHVIARIADISEALGEQAGVGGVETAGHLVSYLAENSIQLETLLRSGVLELPPEWIERGRLTWRAQIGAIVRPERARQARVIKRLEQGAPA